MIVEKKLLRVPVDMIDEPEQDLRGYRGSAFSDVLRKDLEIEGLLAPVIVRSLQNGRFQLVDGKSRLDQLRLLGETRIDAVVLFDCSDQDALIYGLKLNVKRKAHDPMGLARCFRVLHDRFKMRVVDIAVRFGFSKGHVSKLLKLNKLAPELQTALSTGEITIQQAYDSLVHGSLDFDRKNRSCVCEGCGAEVDISEVEDVRLCYRCRATLVDMARKRREQLERLASEQRARDAQKTLDKVSA